MEQRFFDYLISLPNFCTPHDMKSIARFANPSFESSLMVLYILLRTDGSHKKPSLLPRRLVSDYSFFLYGRLYVVEQGVRALLPRGLMDWW